MRTPRPLRGLLAAAVVAAVVAALAATAVAQPTAPAPAPPAPAPTPPAPAAPTPTGTGSGTGAPAAPASTEPAPPPTAEEFARATAPQGTHKVTWDILVAPPRPSDCPDGLCVGGKHLRIMWKRSWVGADTKLVVLRRAAGPKEVGVYHQRYVGQDRTPALVPDFLHPTKPPADATVVDAGTLPLEVGAAWGEWTLVAVSEEKDGVLINPVEPDVRYVYTLVPAKLDDAGLKVLEFKGQAIVTAPTASAPVAFNTAKWWYGLFILLTAAAFLTFIRVAKRRGADMYIRRIPGVDAIEDAVGRSTEMGRPVLYVTGIEEITDIQTIASLLILGHVAEMTAEYDTEIKVANTYPMTMVVAEEIVRNSYTNVGRVDAHRPENIMFITSEQFAFAAAVNGMIVRDRPATNIYFGRFFAESLMLAETGFLTGAIQIAGTAEFTQLPFFIAACDYTLIGEELYATGAYLSREPNQVAQIKAGDTMKIWAVLWVLAGVIAATAWKYDLIGKVIP